MFSFIKAKLGIGKHLDLIKEINSQKSARTDLLELKPSTEDEPSTIIYNANLELIQANITALAKTLSQVLHSRTNNEIMPHKIIEMIHHPFPKEIDPIMYYADLKDDIYLNRTFGTIGSLLSEKHQDLQHIEKYINFMKDSKFNKRFRELYTRKIFDKLVKYMEKYDRRAAEYIDHSLYISNSDLKSAISSIETIESLVNIHRCLISNEQNTYMKIENKKVIILEFQFDEWLINFIKNCNHFEAVVIVNCERIKKEFYDE